MTGVITHEQHCVVRSADSEEQAFYACVAAEAGFDAAAGSDSDTACSTDEHGRVVEVRVAFRQGRVVGFYQLATTTCTDDVAVLDYLYVHHQARRTGVGRALFDDLRDWISTQRVAAVRVVADPAAESFFHRVGAERIGTVGCTGSVPWSRPEFRVSASS